MTKALDLGRLLGSGYQLPTGSIADAAVTTPKIADGAVVAVDIANGAITRPKIGYTGGVLQVVQTIMSDPASTTSNLTWVDVPSMTVTITPSFASSRILVIPDAMLGCDGGLGVNYQLRLQRNGSNIYTPTNKGNRPEAIFEIESSVSGAYDYQFFCTTRMFLDSPNTTSAVTYKLQWRVFNGGTVYLNRNHVDSNDESQVRTSSSMTVMEITG